MVKKTSGGCWDLSRQIDSKEVEDAFSKLVSGGRLGYKTVIERKKEPLKCKNCEFILEGSEKFCPECGARVRQEELNKEESQKESN